MKKIVKVKDDKVRINLNVGDCQVDIIIKRVRDSKPTVHIEDVPVDCRRHVPSSIDITLILAVLLAMFLFMGMVVLFM